MRRPGRSIIGADSTMRSNQRLPHARRAASPRRPSNAPAQRTAAGNPASPPAARRFRRRPRSRRNRGHSPCGIAQPPRRMALAAPVDHRHGKTAVAQVTHGLEIFSICSPRPVKTQTVPLRLAGGAQRAKRNSAPSGVLMVPERRCQAPDWRGSRRASWQADRLGENAENQGR